MPFEIDNAKVTVIIGEKGKAGVNMIILEYLIVRRYYSLADEITISTSIWRYISDKYFKCLNKYCPLIFTNHCQLMCNFF